VASMVTRHHPERGSLRGQRRIRPRPPLVLFYSAIRAGKSPCRRAGHHRARRSSAWSPDRRFSAPEIRRCSWPNNTIRIRAWFHVYTPGPCALARGPTVEAWIVCGMISQNVGSLVSEPRRAPRSGEGQACHGIGREGRSMAGCCSEFSPVPKYSGRRLVVRGAWASWEPSP